MKHTPERIMSRLEDAEEQLSALEDRVMGSTQATQQKEKKILRNEDRLRDLWDNKCANTSL